MPWGWWGAALNRGKAPLQLSAGGGLEGIPSSAAVLILSASLWAAAGALVWCRELEPCCACHNPAMGPVTAALPEAAAAVPEGKGQQAMGADTKRRETVSSEGQKEKIQSINPIRCGEFRHYQKPVILEL